MAIKKFKTNHKIKIKCGPIHKLKTIKDPLTQTDQTTNTTHISRTLVFKIFNTHRGENSVSSARVQIHL
jgi:hypothetical protein